MRPRESVIENHLRKRVKETGGEHRKCGWIGRRGAPDDLCGWPAVQRHGWAECKRPGETATDQQLREHAKMRAWGCIVVVLDTLEAVDEWVEVMSSAVMPELM